MNCILVVFLAMIAFVVGEGFLIWVGETLFTWAFDNRWLRDHHLFMATCFPAVIVLFLIGIGILMACAGSIAVFCR
jgi:hypothetical protein